ncbi:MAG: hypothetical protein V4574_18760 [Pseudomonadota bacterium]
MIANSLLGDRQVRGELGRQRNKNAWGVRRFFHAFASAKGPIVRLGPIS